MNREEQFQRIKKAYQERDNALLTQGLLPMRSTDKGFWGVSNLDDVYAFFEKKQFPSTSTFLDLGSGDGRVVCVASLFVDAKGIEYDPELVAISQEMIGVLQSTGICEQGDFFTIDFSLFDILYSYADQRWEPFKEKLFAELRGELYLYHQTYQPDFLSKQKITWINQIPIFCYTNPKK